MPEAQSDAARIFGERLRSARQATGSSQEHVADLAHIHVTNYGKIERGQANPSLTTIVRIAGVLDIDPGDLVTGLKPAHLPHVEHDLTVAEFIRERTKKGAGRR
ncbi:helix-turn-helix transcriptional regulator [Agromyces intestinalis]|uniref:Helix-turn-helix transcriptional regulator n=1 Tax=Agromyces intestinalis TaxID=2592652 RepID=A0A5C1YJ34_9MICO|nr:helix-turn-helix transcriptional regulator [Agromyces intestinalis]QEO15598.1 helix-turn-helix transcriptional regulator [Agromyces intestinalis]